MCQNINKQLLSVAPPNIIYISYFTIVIKSFILLNFSNIINYDPSRLKMDGFFSISLRQSIMIYLALQFYKRKSKNTYIRLAWHTCSCCFRIIIFASTALQSTNICSTLYFTWINGYWLQVYTALHILGKKTGTCGLKLRYTFLFIILFDKLTGTSHRYTLCFIF